MIWFHAADPIAFSLHGFHITWYSLSYIAGLVASIYAMKNFIKKSHPKTAQSLFFEPGFTYICMGIIVGGRLGHVLLYDPGFYWDNPSEVFAIWQGGMSFHGGLAGVWIALRKLSQRAQDLSWGVLCSIAAFSAPLGIMLGRIANFINSELPGKPTHKHWGVVFSHIDQTPRHPVQLYEALLEGPVLWTYLWFMFKKLQPIQSWELCVHFVYGYSTLRFFAEFFKESQLHCALTPGQWYCLLSVAFTYTANKLQQKNVVNSPQ